MTSPWRSGYWLGADPSPQTFMELLREVPWASGLLLTNDGLVRPIVPSKRGRKGDFYTRVYWRRARSNWMANPDLYRVLGSVKGADALLVLKNKGGLILVPARTWWAGDNLVARPLSQPVPWTIGGKAGKGLTKEEKRAEPVEG